ncbi:MAG TPA: SPFH domain-containing protein [Gemmataceae bacterium]|nr:SPFH domain-containing protein [Gemmataceae bacterium]
MLGVRYIKVPPTTYVMQFTNGRPRRQGTGLSFFYFAPRSTLAAVPVASTDVPFIFNEITADFQAVTVQGHLTYRVTDPQKLAQLLDYSVLPGRGYATDDPDKLPLRITHAAQTATRAEVQARPLRAVLVEADAIAQRVLAAMTASPALQALGVEVLGFSILAIKPVPETAKALEAEARERLLREADDAIYARRNNAVEQERKIRENELNTEVAVEAKQREIEETRLAGQIALEEQRRQLVATEADNRKTRADAEAYAVEATLKPLTGLDPKSLQVLAARSVDPRLLVAMAFQEIAANATKVGNLNISPELLETLLHRSNGHEEDETR